MKNITFFLKNVEFLLFESWKPVKFYTFLNLKNMKINQN